MSGVRPDAAELLRFVRGGFSDDEARRFALEIMDDPVLVDWVRWLSEVDQAASALPFEQVPPEVTRALHALFGGRDGGDTVATLRADSRTELTGVRTSLVDGRIDGSYTLLLTSTPGDVVVDVFTDETGRWAQVDVVRPDGRRADVAGGSLLTAGGIVDGVVVNGRLEFATVPAGALTMHLTVDGGRVQATFEEGW